MAAKTALELIAELPEYSGKTPLDLAVENYNLWYKANQALSLSKSYKIDNGQSSKRELTRADADEITANMNFWEEEIARLQDTSINAPKIRTIFTVGYPS